MRMARVGILLDTKAAERRWSCGIDVFDAYLGEILAHRGIPFDWVRTVRSINDHYTCDVLLVAAVDETKESEELLWKFMERGGLIVSFAGLNGLAQRFGLCKGASAGIGYAELPHGDRPLRFLNAVPWAVIGQGTATGAEAPKVLNIGCLRKESPAGGLLGPALQQFAIGKGCLDRFAVDVVGTIVRLQQGGKPIVEDGLPAPDGTAAVNDGVLKADDQIELDYSHDRVATETGIPLFVHPYADLWRDQLIGHLLRRTAERGLTLPFLAYWPEGTEQVAHISHDSDYNLDEHAEATLALLKECDVRSTWCMLEPGYSRTVYKQVEAEGHELALHYNAVHADHSFWDGDEFRRQYEWLREAAGLTHIPTNKNHLTRMEGWGELFRWCEACGIESEQSRGGSKKGNLGFTFGTCQPYFPIARFDERNRLYDVLEVGFLSPDLELPKWGDRSIVTPLLEQVAKVQGVAHFLVHQYHIYHSQAVRDSVRYVVEQARQRGFAFWTNREINDWVRARRRVAIVGIGREGGIVADHVPAGDNRVAAWIPVAEHGPDTVELYGVPCRKAVLSN